MTHLVSGRSFSHRSWKHNTMRVVLTGSHRTPVREVIRSEHVKDEDLEQLNRLIDEIEMWNKENSATESKRSAKLHKDRVITIELSCDEKGMVHDEDQFEKVLKKCQDEYIKVRLTNNVTPKCVLKSLSKNNSPECRRRERPKTIAEYIV